MTEQSSHAANADEWPQIEIIATAVARERISLCVERITLRGRVTYKLSKSHPAPFADVRDHLFRSEEAALAAMNALAEAQ